MPLHHTPDLKPRSAWLLAFLLFLVMPSRAALQLSVEPEEASGVFWAAQTVKTKTELLFSFRVRNDDAAERPVILSWRIEDAAGKVWLKDGDKLSVAARAAIVRRVLFDAPARGAYVLKVEAKAKRDGPDDRVVVEEPFAVVATPSKAMRPHSFFALTAPTILSADDLSFYKRIGARVLRSNWLPGATDSAGQPITELTLDSQFQVRANNDLTTQAVLPYQTGLDDTLWLTQTQSAERRYRGIENWEVEGSLPAETLSDWGGSDANVAARCTTLGRSAARSCVQCPNCELDERVTRRRRSNQRRCDALDFNAKRPSQSDGRHFAPAPRLRRQ